MKFVKYIALSSVLALSLTSCEDWLDVNESPNEPNATTIKVENRLPWIQKEFSYSAGCANTRTFATCGGFYSTGAMNGASITWNPAASLVTTPYQTWFTGTASNIPYLYDKAEAEGAYHYMGAAEVMHALGFMEMLDLYGEMPYTDALTTSNAPAYSNGKEIWEGCIKKIDHAIELFSKTQEPGATALKSGDIWNGGDASKWLKLCYGLKARWLLRVSKNSEYFKPDEILACLAKAPQSIDDDTYAECFDVKGDKTDFLISDPIQTNGNWNTAAYGKAQWVSKYYLDLLTNLRGAGVEDPRASKIIPSSMTNIQMDGNGNVTSYDWRLSKGIDFYGDAKRLVAGGATSITVQSLALAPVTITYKFSDNQLGDQPDFIDGFKANGYVEATADVPAAHQYKVGTDNSVTVCYPKGAWYVNSANYVLAGDTAYVNYCSGSQNTNNGAWGMRALDTYYHSNDKAAAVAGGVSGTGSFQIYTVSDFDVITYAEMCFIKAEVLMRKGDKGGAHTAYKNGIQANIDRMQKKLNQWDAQGYTNPSMQPMDAADIAAYMASDAVCQSSGSLTMSDIMLQKYIAMGWSLENWVDMRRFNYSAGNIGGFGVVYPGYGRTRLFTGNAALRGTTPDDVEYWIRRWRLPALETSYNTASALAINAHVFDTYIWGIPVWWDCTSDAEYFNFLK